MPARVTGYLGLALGIILAVFSVFELLAFSIAVALFSVEDVWVSDEIKIGPTFGLAVTAWIFGVAGTILILTLRNKATAGQDGPCRKPAQQVPVPPAAIHLPAPAKNVRKSAPPAYTEDTVTV